MIKQIYIAAEQQAEQVSLTEVAVVAGRGIVGDRNFGSPNLEQNVTFVEAEEIDRFNRQQRTKIPPGGTRRNIVTDGVRLNELVGKEFSVGQVRFRGIELCEPCATLGAQLANQRMTAADVVKALVGRAGLRATVLNDGQLAVGMPLRLKATGDD